MTESSPVDIPPGVGPVVVTAALQQVSQHAANSAAQIAITSYVQDGQAHEGSWPLVAGRNITSVTGSLKVTSADATGTIVIFSLN